MHARLTTIPRRAGVAVLLAIALVVGSVTAAGAQGGTDWNGPPPSNPDRNLEVEILVEGSTARNVDSPWGECTFIQRSTVEVVLEMLVGILQWMSFSGTQDLLAFLDALREGEEITGIEDLADLEGNLVYWNDVTCPNELLQPGGRAIWPVGDAIPQRVVDAMTQRAYDMQELPLFYANAAPTGTVDDPFVTGVETHLWISSALFQPVVAEAEIPGLMRVTVTATPADPVWRAGDRTAPFTCGGPGEPWNDGDRVAECGHVYQDSTSIAPSGTFTLAVTTTWNVVSECVNLATGGSCGGSIMPPRILTTTRPVTVAEIQAIVTRD